MDKEEDIPQQMEEPKVSDAVKEVEIATVPVKEQKLLETDAIPEIEDKELEAETLQEEVPEPIPDATVQSELYITNEMTSMATSLQAVTKATSSETKAREMDKYPLQEIPSEATDVTRTDKELDEFVSAIVSEDEPVTGLAKEEEPSSTVLQITTVTKQISEDVSAETSEETVPKIESEEEKVEIIPEVEIPVTTTKTTQITEVEQKTAITEDGTEADEPETTIYVTRDRKSMVSSLQAMARASIAGTKSRETEVVMSPQDVTTVEAVPVHPPEGDVDRDIEAELLTAIDDVSETGVHALISFS